MPPLQANAYRTNSSPAQEAHTYWYECRWLLLVTHLTANPCLRSIGQQSCVSIVVVLQYYHYTVDPIRIFHHFPLPSSCLRMRFGQIHHLICHSSNQLSPYFHLPCALESTVARPRFCSCVETLKDTKALFKLSGDALPSTHPLLNLARQSLLRLRKKLMPCLHVLQGSHPSEC